jgi:predicted nuclease with TOPRIM domain
MTVADLTAKLIRVFPPNQAEVLAEAINDAYQDLVKTSDFTELKGLVRNILVIQERTEIKVEELAGAQRELAEAQTRTEVKVEELAEAQKRTEVEIAKLTEAQRETRQTVGSLANTFGVALENEAYRNLPAFLEREHNLTVTKRMIRHQIGGEEIDFLAEAKRGKTPALIVGESKTTLAAHDVTQLLRKAEVVKANYKKRNGHEIVPVMIVHRAREKEIRNAKKKGVIVVQSFEW